MTQWDQESMRKTFLLGVGCQKGGTTWLHDYLSEHPNANMGFQKEYHVFDALFVPECKFYLKHIWRQTANLIKKGALPSGDSHKILKLLSFYLDMDEYVDYFWDLANKSADTSLVGDMTPSYSALPKDAFTRIKEGLQKRNFDVKVIFLMRDPVERCVSAVRMERRKDLERSQTPTQISEEVAVRQAYSTRDHEIRTRYDLTIKNLEAVFRPEDILYCFSLVSGSLNHDSLKAQFT